MAAHGPPMIRVVHVGEVNSAAACGLVCLVRDDWRGRGLSLNVVKERALNGFTVSQFHSFTVSHLPATMPITRYSASEDRLIVRPLPSRCYPHGCNRQSRNRTRL